MIQKLIILILGSLLSLTVTAQLRLSGLVEHENHPLSEVTIKVKEDGKVIRTVPANRRGKYQLDLDFNKYYTLVFSRPFMFPVSIDVDSSLESYKGQELLYEVPLNMLMFYRYDVMEDGVTDQSIGKIEKTGSGEEAFSFVANTLIIEQLKPLHKESLKREADNESASGSKPSEKALINESLASEAIETSEKEAGSVDISVVRSDAQSIKYETIEQAKTIELETAKQTKQRENNVQTGSAAEEQKYIEDSKRLRAEFYAQDKAREEALIAARLQKQQASIVLAPLTAPVLKSVISSPRLISHYLDEGVFLFEESFLVEQDKMRHEYKKAVYNWLLFDRTYYTRDKDEISQNEYESIKKLLDI